MDKPDLNEHGKWPIPAGRAPGEFQPDFNPWHDHNADLIVPHGPSAEEIRLAFAALPSEESYFDNSATDRIGLHAAGRGVLSSHH